MTFRRVVVALGPSSASAMTAAVDLAQALETELLGLFVEDVELFHLAALPFAGEVAFPSAARRALDVEALERGLRAQAGRLRQDLAARLSGGPVRLTFEVVRGRVTAELVATVGERDLLVVSVPRRMPTGTRPRLQVAQALRGLPVPVVLIDEAFRGDGALGVVASTQDAPAAIAELVAALAPRCGPSALFVRVGPDGPEWDAWQHDVRGRLAAHGIGGRFRTVADVAQARAAAAAERAPLVVALAQAPAAREALIDALPCPLVVLPEPDAARDPVR